MIQKMLRNTLKILIVFAMLIVANPIMAQTSGDKLYSQGLELQKKQTVQSQKAAIAKFQSAKKLYDSAVKKKQCDDAIAVSNNIIKGLDGKKTADTHSGGKGGELKASVLELSNEKLQLDSEARSVTVNITTTESEWSITPVANSDGVAFVSVTQHPENNSFEIVCSANNSTSPRQQKVEVRAGNLRKELIVEQNGIPTVLSVEKAVVEFTNKGGSKSIEIYSNSETKEADNNNRNWKVVSKPNWVNVIGEEYKGKGVIGGWVDKAKGLIKNNVASSEDPSVVVSVMKIVAESKPKNESSRSGEIVISSGNQQATIIVQQN